MSGHRRVVIVGGGIAGWTVAASLREGGYDDAIVIIEREAACYDRPPLSKTALVDHTPLDALRFADDAKLAELRIETRVGRTATALNAADLSVTLDDGAAVAADAVVLATGAFARVPAFPGAALPGVSTLRTYADAVTLQGLLGRRVAVVGAGLIGAEAAAALHQAGSPVVLIDPNQVPGVRAFGPTMAGYLHAMHADHGVDTRTDRVTAVTAAEGGELRVQLTGGGCVDVDGVLVGTGIVIDTTLADHAGLDVDEGIVVDDAGRTSAAGIFAVGDATRRRLPGGLAASRGHWEAARLDGRAVAAAILGTAPDPRGADWFWSDRYGHHIEVVGDMAGDGREVVRPGPHPTAFRIDGDRLLGAASVDDPMAVRAARRLIDRSVAVSVDQLSDPGVPLRSLLPRG
ncbi:FAD-dependent oxidoreductase [Microbacterium sp. zg.B48]|uniref:NAD(P)/FAD-dependent oxidoreductase n=1 Tax=Microbacterium sp. zg.B48 TaxID=2969408 RepID=UPI00214B6508|nr:FAD-dependent oxidoreductase [Microbacterium sp. zg.B48]MCR2762533.1 FAD-dependent oxidoreductase [Microbacterium sp. zg.B48]